MRRTLSFLSAGAIALGAVLSACASEAPAVNGLPHAIGLSSLSVALSPANLKERHVGRLIYRGGIQITSDDQRFGGLSGLIVSADGKRMLAQSDEAHWFRANLVYDAGGNLIAVEHGELADMLNLSGSAMSGKEGDAEGIAALSPRGPDGKVAISFERNHRVWTYDLSDGLDARPSVFPTPPDIKTLPFNSGLESLTPMPQGPLLTVAETADPTTNDHRAWLLGGRDAVDFQTLSVKDHAPYEISDGAFGPDGNLYLLERHYFGPLQGVVIAVREIDGKDVKPGAVLDGREIASFTMRENIDNMEGIALRRDAQGKTLVYIVSDDNYSSIERTLLLMFELAQ
ncbi:MAG: esterase-like activity of phytase family protein [Proteobacteria bacterium]|nr:esterase-like activity of phytase family protein [Pseudomonadota bacterium]